MESSVKTLNNCYFSRETCRLFWVFLWYSVWFGFLCIVQSQQRQSESFVSTQTTFFMLSHETPDWGSYLISCKYRHATWNCSQGINSPCPHTLSLSHSHWQPALVDQLKTTTRLYLSSKEVKSDLKWVLWCDHWRCRSELQFTSAWEGSKVGVYTR